MQKSQQRPQFEFVAIMASLMSIVALAIDALLPAMSTIGIDINSLDPTENQKFITMIFLGGSLLFTLALWCFVWPVYYAYLPPPWNG